MGFLLNRESRGTLLRFTHGSWRAETDYFVACNTVWGGLLFRLKAVAEGRPAGFTTDGLPY